MNRPTQPTPREVQEVAQQRATVDLRFALKAVGLAEVTGYRLAKVNELPFPVLRVGRLYKVPTSGLLAALGLEPLDPDPRQLTA